MELQTARQVLWFGIVAANEPLVCVYCRGEGTQVDALLWFLSRKGTFQHAAARNIGDWSWGGILGSGRPGPSLTGRAKLGGIMGDRRASSGGGQLVGAWRSARCHPAPSSAPFDRRRRSPCAHLQRVRDCAPRFHVGAHCSPDLGGFTPNRLLDRPAADLFRPPGRHHPRRRRICF